MAADPADADPLVDPVLTSLQELEAALLGVLATAVAEGWTSARTRSEAARVATRIGRTITGRFLEALAAAFTLGVSGADRDVPGATPTGPRPSPPRSRPELTLIQRLVRQAPSMVVRVHDKAAREVTDAMTAGQYPTRRAAAGDLLQRWAAQGITGFTDAAGRSWDLVSYGEVVTRTTTAQTLVDAHLTRLSDSGHDLVIISDAPEECPICRIYEGKVLSVSGATSAGPHTVDGAKVTVFASVAQAKADGVWHPNCRHRALLYLPGITPPITRTADPEGARLRADQRARERRVRAHKRRVLVAEQAAGKRSPEAAAARAKLTAYQRDFAAWRAEHDRKNLTGRTSLTVR